MAGKISMEEARQLRRATAQELHDLMCELEEGGMPEGAAYGVACERMGIDPMDGYDYLELLDTGEKE